MAKKLKASKPFTYQVGVPSDSSDPSKGTAGNPSKVRTSATYQHVTGKGPVGHTTYSGIISGTNEGATCEITVTANVAVTNGDSLILGDYELIEGVHWELGGSEALTATAIATAISNLKGFDAEVNGVVDTQVDVTGPVGPSQVKLKLIKRSGNLSVSPDSGYMTKGGPSLGAPTIS